MQTSTAWGDAPTDVSSAISRSRLKRRVAINFESKERPGMALLNKDVRSLRHGMMRAFAGVHFIYCWSSAVFHLRVAK